MKIKFIDLFSGMGGLRLGFERALSELGLEGECLGHSEIKPHALQVYNDNFGSDGYLGDITKIDEKSLPNFDYLLSGFPCLVGDTLILTKRGLVRLDSINIGDMVLSHDCEYHKVIDKMNQGFKETYKIKAMCNDEIRATSNHKFYIKERSRIKDKVTKKYNYVFSEPKWMTVDEIMTVNFKNLYMATPLKRESIIPEWSGVTVYKNQIVTELFNKLDTSEQSLWYIVGRYLGDGWLGKNRKGTFRKKINKVVICCGKHKAAEFEKKLSEIKYLNYSRVEERTSIKYHFTNTELANFLNQFGEYAGGKKLPGFVYSLPINLINSLLEGYMDSDGCYTAYNNRFKYTSVNRELIYGISYCVMIAKNKSISITKNLVANEKFIEGRLVNQNDFYDLYFKGGNANTVQSYIEEDYIWYPIRSIEPMGKREEVWDISVEDSESFVANNCITHNCQAFSMAGKRLGFEDTRGTLFFDVARILKEKQPKGFILENVEGLVEHDLSTEDKKKGKKIGKTLETILNVLDDLGYTVSWKVIQASDIGVAQIRRRIYIVGTKKNAINLDFEKHNLVSFGDIQEYGLPTLDTTFTKAVFNYLDKNNLNIDYLYDKAIRDKRGSKNNIHSWDLGLRGKVSSNQREFLELLVTERRKREYSEYKGYPIKDGLGLTIEDIKTFSNISKEELEDLVLKKYLKVTELDGKYIIYDINSGKLSFEFAKILDPSKPCLTLVATDVSKMAVIDNGGIRRLTVKEGLRLNGFPDDFKMNIPYNKSMDLLGNTVVVTVIKEISNRLLSEN